jgi:hypothetical protein
MVTNQGAPGVLVLLGQLEEVGAVAVRHGRFIGCLHADRVPRQLWRELDRCERQLRLLLPDLPTPWRRRRAGGAA